MPGIENDEAYEGAHAARLVTEALQRSGVTKAVALAALESGVALALGHYGQRPTWPRATEHERAAAVVGRLLMRISRELGWPITGPGESSSAFVRGQLSQ